MRSTSSIVEPTMALGKVVPPPLLRAGSCWTRLRARRGGMAGGRAVGIRQPDKGDADDRHQPDEGSRFEEPPTRARATVSAKEGKTEGRSCDAQEGRAQPRSPRYQGSRTG